MKYYLSLSYVDMMAFIDAQFPPIGYEVIASDPEKEPKEEFTTFNFWKDPILHELPFDLPELT